MIFRVMDKKTLADALKDVWIVFHWKHFEILHSIHLIDVIYFLSLFRAISCSCYILWWTCRSLAQEENNKQLKCFIIISVLNKYINSPTPKKVKRKKPKLKNISNKWNGILWFMIYVIQGWRVSDAKVHLTNFGRAH